MNEILRELKLMKNLAVSINIPKPTYMYVKLYGRDIRNDMGELAKEMGYGKYIIFDRMSVSQGKKYVDAFNIIMEKEKPLGQSYEGCVLVDFTGMNEIEDIAEFISYLGQQNDKSAYIFTLEETKNTVLIQEELERYFFVRKIIAEEYSVEEQCELVERELKLHAKSNIDIHIEECVHEALLLHMAKCQWKASDMVELKLKNIVAKMIYETIVDTRNKDIVIDESFIKKMFETLNVRTEEKSTFGFCIGG